MFLSLWQALGEKGKSEHWPCPKRAHGLVVKTHNTHSGGAEDC